MTTARPGGVDRRYGTAHLTGVVLAGGLGSRFGSPKATASLADRPLLVYPVEALRGVAERVVVVAKADTELPDLAERWDEPDEPRHPVAGLTYALECAAGAILVVAADMPFVTSDVLRLVSAELRPDVAAAVARSPHGPEPLLAAYSPAALATLRTAPPGQPLRRTVEALAPVLVDVPPEAVFNVNTPDDLAEAERRLKSG